MKTSLKLDALEMAVGRRRLLRGVFHYSGRGSQYASCAYRTRLYQNGILAYMSRKGNCWDYDDHEAFIWLSEERMAGYLNP